MTLDLAAIRDSNGQMTKELDVPEIKEGETLRIRMMSGTDMFRLTEHATKRPEDMGGLTRMLFVACAIDDDGNKLFTPQTVSTLIDKPGLGPMILRLSEEIQQFCGLSKDDEEAAENSEPIPA